jgi:hypothetical protein
MPQAELGAEAERTSFSVTRPPIPVPERASMSTPSSLARRRTAGVARVLPALLAPGVLAREPTTVPASSRSALGSGISSGIRAGAGWAWVPLAEAGLEGVEGLEAAESDL